MKKLFLQKYKKEKLHNSIFQYLINLMINIPKFTS